MSIVKEERIMDFGFIGFPTPQLAPPPQPAPPQAAPPVAPKPAAPQPADDPPPPEDGIDGPSAKGIFGWVTLDGVSIPCLYRDDKQYVSVRIVELKLLSKFPNTFPDDLGEHEALVSYYVTSSEVKLLNEINEKHCDFEYGHTLFTDKDLIVRYSDFEDFYSLVKKTFPEEIVNARSLNIPISPPSELAKQKCGWIQVNNTVTPYIRRETVKFVVLPVMKYAANLLKDVKDVDFILPTETECVTVNGLCTEAGLNFKFSKNTKLVTIEEIRKHHEINVIELPTKQPLKWAKYQDKDEAEEAAKSPPKVTPPTQPAIQEIEKMSNTLQKNLEMMVRQKGLTPLSQIAKASQSAQMPGQMPQNAQSKSQSQHHITSQQQQQQQFMSMQYAACGLPPGVPPPPYAGMPYSMPPHMMQQRPQFPGHGYMQDPAMSQQTPTMPLPPGYNMQRNQGPLSNQNLPIQHMMQMSPNQVSPSMSPSGGPPNMCVNPFNGQSTFPFSSALQQSASHPNKSGMSSHNSTPSPHSVTPTLSSSNTISAENPFQTSMPRKSPLQVPPPRYSPKTVGMQLMSPHQLSASPNSVEQYARDLQRPPSHSMSPPAVPLSAHMMPMNNAPVPSQSQQHFPMSQSPNPPVGHSLPPQTRNIPPGHRGGHPMPQNIRTSRPHIQNVPLNVPALIPHNKQAIPDPTLLQKQMTAAMPQPITQVQTIQQANKPLSIQSNAKTTIEHAQELLRPEVENIMQRISSIKFKGKILSCLEHEKREGKFSIIEAIGKLYFQEVALNEFLFVLEKVLTIPTLTCTDEEEKAFIKYYNLPVVALKCNKMISLSDLEKYFPQLTYTFKKDEPVVADDSQRSGSKRKSMTPELVPAKQPRVEYPPPQNNGLLQHDNGQLSSKPF